MLVNKNHNCFVVKLQRKARQLSEHVEYMVFNTTAMFYLGYTLEVYLLFCKRKIFTLSKQIVLINMNMQKTTRRRKFEYCFSVVEKKMLQARFDRGDEKKTVNMREGSICTNSTRKVEKDLLTMLSSTV